ncbi:MAG: hypothetical protein WBZ36_22145 [Candidatus Nitrosopolaris sp.]
MVPIRFGPVIKKIGLKFDILGHEFGAVLDTGSLIEPRFMPDKQTAEMVGIQKFHKSSRPATVHFIESGTHHLPIYEDIPLTIKGVSTIYHDVILGGNNLVNPSIFLPNHDIAFHGNKITFLPKGSPRIQGGISLPYLKGTETAFNWRIGHHVLPMLLDTGEDWNMVSPKTAHDIGLLHYEKIAKWIKDEDDFEWVYITPVSLPGTPVQFMSEVHIGLGRSIISGPELLQNHWGFTLRERDVEFYRT